MPGPLDGLRQWTGPGNVNLFSRPRVTNPDGTTSTVRSMSFEDDGQETLIPTVEQHGKGILDDDAAIAQYRSTGQHLGKFKTPQDATSYAQGLHNQFEQGAYDVPLATSRRSVDPSVLQKAMESLLTVRR